MRSFLHSFDSAAAAFAHCLPAPSPAASEPPLLVASSSTHRLQGRTSQLRFQQPASLLFSLPSPLLIASKVAPPTTAPPCASRRLAAEGRRRSLLCARSQDMMRGASRAIARCHRQEPTAPPPARRPCSLACSSPVSHSSPSSVWPARRRLAKHRCRCFVFSQCSATSRSNSSSCRLLVVLCSGSF